MVTVTPDVYFFALAAAVLWGTNQIFSKHGMEAGGHSIQGAFVVAGGTSVIYWFVLAIDRAQLGAIFVLETAGLAAFLLSGLFWASGWLVVYQGVHRVGASINAAGVNTRPLFASLLAIAFLGEAITLATGVGIVLIVVGLIVLSLSRGGDLRGWKSSDLVFPLAAAACWAVANVLRRFGLSETDATVLQGLAINSLTALILITAYLLLFRRVAVFRSPRRSYGFFTLNALGTSVALFALFEALDRGPIVIVDPLTGTAPLFTALLAYVFLSDLERVTKDLVAGAVLIVIGAAILTTV